MNQGFSQLIIFVVSCAFTQEVLNLKLDSDNSIPIVGGNLILSCLTHDFFKHGVIYWFNPNGTELSRCFSKRGGVCDRNTSSYSFTANISGAYANIDGLERARDGGKWKCTHMYKNTGKVDTIEIVIYKVLNLKLDSDNSIPIVGGNLILSCLTHDFFKHGVIYWFNPNGTELSRCFSKRGGVCDRNTSSYSFTANISGAYANIDGLERARDGGKWKCTHMYKNTGEVDTIEIVIYNAPEINVTVTGSNHLNMTWNVTCEASGFPTNYTFHPWKQMLGEVTIRSDLQGTHEGMINSSKNTLTLNRLSLQDKGTYVCSVESGVRGVNGDNMQTSATVLNVKGTPVVVDKTNVTFTGEIGSSANIYIAFYSDPVVTDFKFQRNGSNVENTSRTLMHLSTNIVEVLFYNKSANLTVSMAHLLIMNLTKDDFDDYNLVLVNSIGKTDFKVQLNPAGRELEVKGCANVAAIAGGIGAAVVVVVILVVLFFIWRRKASMLKNSSDEGLNNNVQGRSNQTSNLYANTSYTADVCNTGYESLQACKTEASPYQTLSSGNTETSDQKNECSESMTIGSAGADKIYMNTAITSPLSDKEYESLQSNQIETNPYQVLNDCSKDCSQPNNIRLSAGDNQLNPYYNEQIHTGSPLNT